MADAWYVTVGAGSTGEGIDFVDFQTASTSTNSAKWRSARGSGGNDDYVILGSKGLFGSYVTPTEVRWRLEGKGQVSLAHNIADYTQPHDFEVEYDQTDIILYVDTIEQSRVNVGSGGFLVANDSGTSGARGAFDFYYLEIYENGVLERNYINRISALETSWPEIVTGGSATFISFDSGIPWTLYDDGTGGGALTIIPSPIASGEVVGSPILTVGAVTISTVSIATAEVVGNPSILQGLTIQPNEIPSEELVGSPIVTPQGVTVATVAIPTEEVVGSPTVLRGLVFILPEEIPSEEVVGTPFVDTVLKQIFPDEILTLESVGRPLVLGGDSIIIPIPSRVTWNAVAKYLREISPSFSGADNDVIMKWLLSEGYEGQINDALCNYWSSLNLEGAYNDKESEWKRS